MQYGTRYITGSIVRMILLKSLALYLIRFYKKHISPFLPMSCRYYPTCSEYCYEAIHKHGLIKGIFFGFFRILRCNPLFKGGYDPVP